MMCFCTESASFDEFAGVMNSFIYKLLDSDYFPILLHLRWTILTPLIIALCYRIASVSSLKKIVSINYLHMGPYHWVRQSVRQKVREEKGEGQDLSN